MDEPEPVGGTGRGPMPTDLLLASLASCYALAVTWAARRQQVELPDLSVTATGTYAGQRFESLTLTVDSSLPADRLVPLLAPARDVCYVSNTVIHPPDLTVDLADRVAARG